MSQPSFRLAPTPSGYLHLGNALNFGLTWLLARLQGGRLRLRIDDLDAPRSQPEFVEDIFRSLEWLGLNYEEGPGGPSEQAALFSQHHRIPLYEAALARLWESGKLFACDCSRKSIRERSPQGLYPGTCRERGLSREQAQVAWRLRTPAQLAIQWQDQAMGLQSILLTDKMPDFVIRRKDQLPAYQLASLVDDQLYGINWLVRGADLRESTAAQLYVADCLGEDRFCQAHFLHHPLLLDEKGEKLAKSAGAASLLQRREGGQDASLVFAHLSRWLGLPAIAHNPAELLAISQQSEFEIGQIWQ
jgi:glutamyl-tRNA synthetase